MSTGIIALMIGGFVTAIVMSVLLRKTKQSLANGELRYGYFLAALGAGCLAFAAFTVGMLFVDEGMGRVTKRVLPSIAVAVGFSLAAGYCFLECFWTRGTYDSDGLSFTTAWTGKKQQRWADLTEVSFNSYIGWYVLSFRDGQKVRISALLRGHPGMLERFPNAATSWKSPPLSAQTSAD